MTGGGLGDRTDLSDEAVEAAAKAYWAAFLANSHKDDPMVEALMAWDSDALPPWIRDRELFQARAALTAAAPLIRSREAERIASEIEDQITGRIEHTHYDSAYAHSAMIARVPRVAR